MLVTVPSTPKSEQAESVSRYVRNTPSDKTDLQPSSGNVDADEIMDENTESIRSQTDIDNKTLNIFKSN